MPPNTNTLSPGHNRLFYLTIAGFVVIILVVAAMYVLKIKQSPTITPEAKKTNQAYVDLKESPEFLSALQAAKGQDYPLAISLFKQVKTNDQDEYSYVQYEIANAQMNISRESGLIAFSDLVASSSINRQTKGYAINAIGRVYSSSHDESILRKAKGLALSWGADSQLLQSFTVATTSDDMLSGLLEIGSSYYPIMDSEMRLAYLYAKTANKEKKDVEVFETYKKKVLTKISTAEADPNYTKISENLSWMLPLSLNRKAMTLEIMKNLGVEVEDPAIYFEKALNLSAAQGIPVQPFILYHYSTYLMNSVSGNENNEKIILMLRPIVENKNSQGLANFFEFTKNAYKNNEVNNIKDLNNLAKIYPPFGEIIR